MKIKIQRLTKKPGYTEGRLTVDGKYYCDTLEDTDRGATQIMPFVTKGGLGGYWVDADGNHIEKVPGKTAIPTGLYDATVGWWSKHSCYCVMLLRVGGFTGILMHNGMTDEHSSGCVLLGKRTAARRLDGSRLYMDALAARVMACQKNGEKVTVEVL